MADDETRVGEYAAHLAVARLAAIGKKVPVRPAKTPAVPLRSLTPDL
jgi:hypothetical protein